MKAVHDIVYSVKDGEELMLDLLLPDEGAFDVFVFFHGGGLEKGSRKGAEKHFGKWLAEHGVAVASVEYRMYPDHKYPDFLVDAANSVKFVQEHIKEYGDAKRIFVGGSSAGGYISMMLCFDRRWYDDAGVDPMSIDGYIHDAGQPTAHFNVLKYAGINPKRVIVDDTAPLYHIGTQEKYPPMTFIVSDNDMKNRYEQTMLVLSTLKHFGHEKDISWTLMHGTHTQYVGRIDEDGESAFGKLFFKFLKTLEE